MRTAVLIVLMMSQIASAQLSLLDPLEKDGIPEIPSAGKGNFPLQIPDPAEKKSVPLAVLFSALLPGMGELYAGNYSTGKYLTAAEGALWVTLIGLDSYGTWLQNDSRTFAEQHAGISLDGKNDQYFVDIGNYNTVSDYNQDALRDRNPYRLYNESSSFAWTWDTHSNREYYRDLRIKSDNMYNSMNFVVAAIAVNHLISAVNAARVAAAFNARADQIGSLRISAGVMGGITNPHGILISVSQSF